MNLFFFVYLSLVGVEKAKLVLKSEMKVCSILLLKQLDYRITIFKNDSFLFPIKRHS